MRVHKIFLSPKLFSAKVKRSFVIIFSVFMEPKKSVNENENKENKTANEF